MPAFTSEVADLFIAALTPASALVRLVSEDGHHEDCCGASREDPDDPASPCEYGIFAGQTVGCCCGWDERRSLILDFREALNDIISASLGARS